MNSVISILNVSNIQVNGLDIPPGDFEIIIRSNGKEIPITCDKVSVKFSSAETVVIVNGMVVFDEAVNVTTTNGNITCDTIKGNVSTVNGNIHSTYIDGSCNTVNGNITTR